jgi:hypothetical protein
MLGNYRVATQLVASRVVLSSVELVATQRPLNKRQHNGRYWTTSEQAPVRRPVLGYKLCLKEKKKNKLFPTRSAPIMRLGVKEIASTYECIEHQVSDNETDWSTGLGVGTDSL